MKNFFKGTMVMFKLMTSQLRPKYTSSVHVRCTTAHGRGECWDNTSQVGGTAHVSNSSARTHPRLSILSVSNLAILLLNLVTFPTILATFFQRHWETKLEFFIFLPTFDKRLRVFSHLPHLVRLNRTWVCFPFWCVSFGQVKMQQSHSGAHQMWTKQAYRDQLKEVVSVRFQSNLWAVRLWWERNPFTIRSQTDPAAKELCIFYLNQLP